MWSIIAGMNPPSEVPVVSVMNLPIVPLELATPFGNCDVLVLRSIRADSNALAASTTTRARTSFEIGRASCRESVEIFEQVGRLRLNRHNVCQRTYAKLQYHVSV